jgi:type IX secretion system PorP/SprF family membrane protein
MNKLFTLVLIFMSFGLFAQQDPLSSQFSYNNLMINPAISGSIDGIEARLMYRMQWVEFPGSPRTMMLTAHGNKKLHGVGLALFYDEAGANLRGGGMLSYAFHLKLSDKSKLGLGIAGRITNWRWQSNVSHIDDLDDPVLANAASGLTRGDASFGVFFKNNNLSIGASAVNLVGTEFNFSPNYSGINDSRNKVAKDYRHYYIHGAYKKVLNKNLSLEPVAMMRTIESLRPQFDAGVKLHLLDEQLSLGYLFRNNENTSVITLGVVFDHSLSINYSYDYSHTKLLQQYAQGSHEFTLGYQFNRNIHYDDFGNKIDAPPTSNP